MSQQKDLRKLAVLGSTGSIGRATLDVVRRAGERMQVVALSAHTNMLLLAEQVREFQPKIIVVTADTVAADLRAAVGGVEVLFGSDALCEVVAHEEIDTVVSAIVGSAGLKSTLCAVEAGKTVALANKESLVVGGELVTEATRKFGGTIIPIDSEHSAIWQCLEAGRRDEVEKIILTASGGPFRDFTPKQLERVTVADALAHPTWNMGKKITIDSATLMNKALEIIEAHWLFDLPPDQNCGSQCSRNCGSQCSRNCGLQCSRNCGSQCSRNCGSQCSLRVVLHPQSIVHSMVEFVDGAVMAQLSPPDMRLPIQWAIDWPHRYPGPARRIDWETMMTLEFFPPDFERFPALRLGLEVAAAGGTAGAVLNAANEVAVEAFLQEKLPFHQITTVCQSILHHHHHEHRPTFAQLTAADRWARLETQKWISR